MRIRFKKEEQLIRHLKRLQNIGIDISTFRITRDKQYIVLVGNINNPLPHSAVIKFPKRKKRASAIDLMIEKAFR